MDNEKIAMKKLLKFVQKLMNKNNKKRYLSCKWLEHGIIFDHANILRVCCAQSHEGKGRYVLKEDYKGEPIDWDDIFAQKRIQRDVQRNGGTFDACKGCIFFEYGEWDKKDYIDMLLLTHWIHCNSKCVYCPAIRDEELIKYNQHYNVLPVIKDMMKRKILSKNAFVSIAGGESTIYPEFEELLHALLDYGISDIVINTSGIKYSPAISKGLEQGKVKILISLDAGTKETHKRLKLVDSFDDVVENLEKYANSQTRDKHLVSTKYIIVPGINDNKEEVNEWLELNKRLGINPLSLDIDIGWFHENNDKVPQEINELIVYSKQRAKELHQELVLYDRAFMAHNQYKKELEKVID